MALLVMVMLRPDPSPHVCFSFIHSQPAFFANTTAGPGLAFWEARSHRAHGPAGLPAVVGILPFPGQKELVGCGIYSTRSGTDVDDIITTSLCVPLGMLNATSPTGITSAFVSFSVVSTGCFRAARLTPIRISSSKVPYPYARILE